MVDGEWMRSISWLLKTISVIKHCKMRKLRLFVQCMIILSATLITAEWLSKTKQRVAVNNIISRFKELSITSCHLKCKSNKKCKSIGMMKNINMGETGKCFLLAHDTYPGEGIGETIEMYVTNAFASCVNSPCNSDQYCEKASTTVGYNCRKILYRWPEGVYGILSIDSCPANWFEFTHCIFTENTPNGQSAVTKSKFDLGSCDETKTSMTFRYCFKGPNVPSRPGGFWTHSGTFGNAFVMENVNNDCTIFGNDGGEMYLDAEDNGKDIYGNNGTNNIYFPDYYPKGYKFRNYGNVQYAFCLIGQAHISSKSDRIIIGEFNQMFGIFIYPDNTTCPVLEGPGGILHATKQNIFIDLEDSDSSTRVVKGRTPFIVNPVGDVVLGVCVYNPSIEENN